VCIGDHTIKTYSKQQKVVALSSAEAELYAMVLATAETMAVQAYSEDLGLKMGGELYTDSSAALGIAKRAGIGKVRHLRTQGLWVQEVRVSGRIAYKKVLGEKNPSDLLTKYMTADLSKRHLDAIAAAFVDGRAESAPEIGSIEDTTVELEDDDGDGGLLSWVRKFEVIEGRKVRFRPSVDIRPIPAVGAGRSCRGPERKKKRGQWPRQERPVSVTSLELTIAATAASAASAGSSESDGGAKSEGELKAVVHREIGGAAAGQRLHDPQQAAAHTCGQSGKAFNWKDAASDSDEEAECAACVDACRQLELPARVPGRWRAKKLIELSSLELGQGGSGLREATDHRPAEISRQGVGLGKRTQREEGCQEGCPEAGCVCADFGSFSDPVFGSFVDPDFVPVRDGHFVINCRVDRSMPRAIELCGAAPLGDWMYSSDRASIESAIVRSAIAPASSGCVPAGHCASFGNSCLCLTRCLSVSWHHVGHVPKGERQSTSLSLALTRTCMGTCTFTGFVERSCVECIAMLPLTHADVQRDEPRLVNRIRGSSPLLR
jgi:hypothetical protein